MALTSEDLNQISKIVEKAVSGLATKQELSALSARLETTTAQTSSQLNHLKQMISEDYEAEAERVTSIDRRLKRLRRDFNDHVANQSAHNA